VKPSDLRTYLCSVNGKTATATHLEVILFTGSFTVFFPEAFVGFFAEAFFEVVLEVEGSAEESEVSGVAVLASELCEEGPGNGLAATRRDCIAL